MVSSWGYNYRSWHLITWCHNWSRNDWEWFPASVGIMTVTWQLWIWIWMDVYMRQDDVCIRFWWCLGEGEATRNRVQRRFLKDDGVLSQWFLMFHASLAWSLIKYRLQVWPNKSQTKPSALWKFARCSILCKAACLAHMDRNLFEYVSYLLYLIFAVHKAKCPIIWWVPVVRAVSSSKYHPFGHALIMSAQSPCPRPIRPGWRFWAAKSNGYPPERLGCFNWRGMLLVSFPT